MLCRQSLSFRWFLIKGQGQQKNAVLLTSVYNPGLFVRKLLIYFLALFRFIFRKRHYIQEITLIYFLALFIFSKRHYIQDYSNLFLALFIFRKGILYRWVMKISRVLYKKFVPNFFQFSSRSVIYSHHPRLIRYISLRIPNE